MARDGSGCRMNEKVRNFALWTIIILLLLALFTLFQNPAMRTSATEISFTQFLNEVDNGRVRNVLITGPEVDGTYTDGRRFQVYAPNDQSWVQRVQSKGVAVTIRPASTAIPSLVSLVTSWLPFILLVGVWIFLSRRMKAATGITTQPPQSPAQIEGIKRRLDDMQKQIDELSRRQ
jgi:cell division protease FtsH